MEWRRVSAERFAEISAGARQANAQKVAKAAQRILPAGQTQADLWNGITFPILCVPSKKSAQACIILVRGSR